MTKTSSTKWILLVVAVATLAIGGFLIWRKQVANDMLKRAKSSIETKDFRSARVYATKALDIRPNHPESLLVYAESVFKDETVNGDQRVEIALEALAKIPDQAAVGADARMREASILFFNRLQPTLAEQSLVRAVEAAGDRLDILQSILQIRCCTGRHTFTEPLFQRLLKSAETVEDKSIVLSSWFLVQFSVETFNSSMNQMLQVEGLYSDKIPVSQKRLLAFRESDPNQFLTQVALANWFYLRNDANQARQLLDELNAEEIDLSNPFYLATAVNVYLEVGEIELAQQLHRYWEDDKYFEYWRQKGVLEQDYQNDLEAACQSFEKALTIWPGAIDPSIYFRLETCWKKRGDNEKSDSFHQQGEKLRNIMSVARIKEMQAILLSQRLSATDCQRFASFYRDLGRQIEEQEWDRLAEAVK